MVSFTVYARRRILCFALVYVKNWRKLVNVVPGFICETTTNRMAPVLCSCDVSLQSCALFRETSRELENRFLSFDFLRRAVASAAVFWFF